VPLEEELLALTGPRLLEKLATNRNRLAMAPDFSRRLRFRLVIDAVQSTICYARSGTMDWT
jgi:hypothetical protein